MILIIGPVYLMLAKAINKDFHSFFIFIFIAASFSKFDRMQFKVYFPICQFIIFLRC